MVDIGLTETVKEDPLKFGLWIQNKSEFYTFQVGTNNDMGVRLLTMVILKFL